MNAQRIVAHKRLFKEIHKASTTLKFINQTQLAWNRNNHTNVVKYYSFLYYQQFCNFSLCSTKYLRTCTCSSFQNQSSRRLSSKEICANEKASFDHLQQPKSQTTIDEEEVKRFSSQAALWWDEGGEFEALHSLNDLRVPLIRDALVAKKTLAQYNNARPLEGFWILDVGSGGGILSEPLARLGASVIGVEASEENIKIAQAHLIHDPGIRDRVKYVKSTVEDLAETYAGKFDAVVASEVLEHVAEPQTFVLAACKLVRPGGSIFFTTLNKTTMSYVLGIVAAENVFHLVAPGTHDWNKFISPSDLQKMLQDNGFITRLVHGLLYNPLSKRWSWTQNTSINYAIHACRPFTSEEGEVGKEMSPLSV